MLGYFGILTCSVFMLYYTLAYMGIFPYFELFDFSGSMYWVMFHGVCAKWALVFGLIGLIFSVAGLLMGKFSKVEEGDKSLNDMQFRLLAFYVVISILLII